MHPKVSFTEWCQYLEAMGIQRWERKLELPLEKASPVLTKRTTKPLNGGPKLHNASEFAPTRIDKESPNQSIDWQQLQQRVAGCTVCGLHKTRIQTVFGVGSVNAEWMVIGEAPGASEDEQGEPFVGKAGMLLNEMLRAVGLKREEVFIANILKCRPPRNRDPNPEEVESCEPFLKQQVASIKPKIILAVGRVAAQNLLKTNTPIGRLRGKLHRYGEIPVVVLYHPAYLLRSPLEKRRAWEDLRFALRLFEKNV